MIAYKAVSQILRYSFSGKSTPAAMLCLALLSVGCGPDLSEEELGDVMYTIPHFSDYRLPHELPELEDSAQAKEESTPRAEKQSVATEKQVSDDPAENEADRRNSLPRQ